METAANAALGAAAAATATASTIQNVVDFLEAGVESALPWEPSGLPLQASASASAALGGAISGIPSLTAVASIDYAYHRRSMSFLSLIAEESSALPGSVRKIPTAEQHDKVNYNTTINSCCSYTSLSKFKIGTMGER